MQARAAGRVLVCASFFGVGKVLCGETALGLGMLALAAAAGGLIDRPRTARREDGRGVSAGVGYWVVLEEAWR